MKLKEKQRPYQYKFLGVIVIRAFLTGDFSRA
jgi:hypothetical protein